jgi:hypothetical protein
MIIVAGGCSLVFGSELKDCDNVDHSLSTWPALLAKEHDYHCVAWGGYSNDAIARTVINKISQVGKCGVIVQWTFPGRYEFQFDYDTGQRKSPWHTITPWTTKQDVTDMFFTQDEDQLDMHKEHTVTAIESGTAEFADTFYKHVGSNNYWAQYSTLKEILYLQMFLKIVGIPYMFTAVDNCIMDNYNLHTDDTIAAVYYSIDWSKFYWFPKGSHQGETVAPRGFYQWAVENKYPMYTTHPQESAHKDAAELIRDTFNEMVTQSN